MTSPTNDLLSEIIKDTIASLFPHLRGRISVRITHSNVLYEVRRGQGGVLVEIGSETLTHPHRKEIVSRCACATQEVHAGLTTARRVTGLDEIHS